MAVMLTVVTGLTGVASDAALDWAIGAAASIAFVALIAIPALALNARDRKRHQAERERAGP